MNFENIKKYKYYILFFLIILSIVVYLILSRKNKVNNTISGEAFIFSFSENHIVDSLIISSPTKDLPSGIALIASSDSGNKWDVLYQNNSVDWSNDGSTTFAINKNTPYTLFSIVITSLSSKNSGLIGKIQLTQNKVPIFQKSSEYDTIKAGTYMSYPGFQFNKLSQKTLSISYTNMITTSNGIITTDNIESLIFTDSGLPKIDFGILNTNTTYSNLKPNNKAPTFQLN
jgi:hypothetical protein